MCLIEYFKVCEIYQRRVGDYIFFRAVPIYDMGGVLKAVCSKCLWNVKIKGL